MMDACAHFGSCGGCSRQGTPYAVQLADKERLVRTALQTVSVQEWHPILASPETVYYRNKMEYSFGNEVDIAIFNGSHSGEEFRKKIGVKNAAVHAPTLALPLTGEGTKSNELSGNLVLKDSSSPREGRGQEWGKESERHTVHIGLHPRKRFALVMPTPECQLLSPEGRKIQAIATAWANEFEIPSFTRKSAAGHLRHLVIREGKNTGERMVKLVAKSETKAVDELAQRLKESKIPITTFFWSVHDGLSDIAHGAENRIYWGTGVIQEKIGRVKVQVTPSSFLQTNTHAAEQMLDVLRGWMKEDVILNEVKDLDSSPSAQNDKLVKVIDLYCGSGTIGLNLTEGRMHLIGVETNSSALDEARATAQENGFSDVEFLHGPTEKLIATHPSLKADENTLVVVDPPRPGLHPTVTETLNTWAVPHLYYVSCNPESLARDLQALSARYTIESVQPMDFFPHTDHIETAVRLKKRP